MTIFSAEALMINVALDFVIRNMVAHSYSVITDSQSELRALSYGHAFSHSLVRGIVKEVTGLKVDGRRVSFLWVKVLSGISGNERTDNLTKLAF